MRNLMDLIAVLGFGAVLAWLYHVQGPLIVYVVVTIWAIRATLMAFSYKAICEITMWDVLQDKRPDLAFGATFDVMHMPWSVFLIEWLRAFFFPTWKLPHVVSKRYRLGLGPMWYTLQELDMPDFGKYPFRTYVCTVKNTNVCIMMTEHGYQEGTYEQ